MGQRAEGVERCARLLYSAVERQGAPPWSERDTETKEFYRDKARDLIEAMRPLVVSQTAEDQRREAIVAFLKERACAVRSEMEFVDDRQERTDMGREAAAYDKAAEQLEQEAANPR